MPKSIKNWDIDFDGRLGKGGYGSVYRCRESDNGDYDAAIKVFDNPSYVNTFEREVNALTLVNELPHTLQLLDYGRDEDNRLCIVTGLIKGQNLKSYVKKNGPLSLENTLNMLKCRLAHMDIKASNIIVSDSDYFLIDWGVAKEIKHKRMEEIHANQDFVAPECYFGKFSVATDFYSLGWLVAFALSGRSPYHFKKIPDRGYRPLAHCLERPELDKAVPDEITPVILNWINKDPAVRCVDYNLNRVLAQARGSEVDFIKCKSVQQLCFEFTPMNAAAQNHIPYAEYSYAEILLTEGRVDEAVYWLEQATEHGYGKAACKLALMLEKEKNSEQSGARVGPLLEFAAERGNNRAKNALAEKILSGTYPGNVGRAKSLLRSAADDGSSRAQYALAKILLDSEEPHSEAIEYMTKAASRGHHRAVKYLKNKS